MNSNWTSLEGYYAETKFTVRYDITLKSCNICSTLAANPHMTLNNIIVLYLKSSSEIA